MANGLASAADFERLGLLDEAIAEYGRLVHEGAAGSDVLIRTAGLHRARGRFQAALADLEAAIAMAPGNPWPQLRLGELHRECGRFTAALDHMRTAMEITPEGEEFQVNVIAVCSRLGWFDLAFQTARRLRPDVSDWWAGARRDALDNYRKQRAEALALLQRRRTGDVFSDAVCSTLSSMLFRLGRLTVARRLCEGLIARTPTLWSAYYLISDIVCRQAGPAAAMAYLRAQPALAQDTPTYLTRLSGLLHEAGRHPEALEALEDPVLNAEDEQIRWLRFMSLFLLGRLDQLKAYCTSWLDRWPDALAPAATLAALRSSASDLSSWQGGQVNLLRPHIAQFWDSSDIPSDVRGVMLSWTAQHPNADYTIFNDASARRFIEAHFGAQMVQTYDACHHAAMKADYFRIAWLYQAGGIYADADELCLRPLGHILSAAEDADIVAVLAGDIPGYVHNFFLAARPRSPILRIALEHANTGIARALQSGGRPGIWGVTGPGLITRAIGRQLAKEPANGTRDQMLLLARQQYASFARTETRLAYKAQSASNWTLA